MIKIFLDRLSSWSAIKFSCLAHLQEYKKFSFDIIEKESAKPDQTDKTPENKDLTVLEIEGFSSGLTVGLVYDKKNENNETVQKMKKFIDSETWEKALVANDFMPLP